MEPNTPNTDIYPDVVQHCVLFPTYATNHSRSGSKDPLDWNIRVKGWAFTKRSNRRKRLVMSMARKLAGVTKDNKVYETLESRFGMFLASNTQGARFTVQCIGPAKADKMDIGAGDEFHDESTEALIDDSKAPDAKLAAQQVVEDKEQLRTSLSGPRGELIAEAELNNHSFPEKTVEKAAEKFKTGIKHPQEEPESPPESHEPSFADRWSKSAARLGSNGWSKGAAMMRGAYEKYKSTSTTDLANTSSPNFSSESRPSSIASDRDSGASTPSSAITEPQTNTYYDNIGHGELPTIKLSSQPGGHFDGTLRITHEDVQSHKIENKLIGGQQRGGHPRYLKLHASHSDMPCMSESLVNLIDPEGISVISDIDDTIKDTNILAGAKMVLENTFLKEMQDVPGMAAVYYKWWEDGVAFHYVSNSPWQLIPSLLEFFKSHNFPPGSAHLRLIDSVLKTYFMTPGEHKRRTVREILADFPGRQYILVGDSGEIDMEIYTEMAVEFPKQILKIFIRDITTSKLTLEEEARAAALARSRAMSSSQKTSLFSYTTGLFSKYTSESSASPNRVSPGSPDIRSPSSPSTYAHAGSINSEGTLTDQTRESSSTYSVTSIEGSVETTSNQGLSPYSSVTRISAASTSTELSSNSSTITVTSTNVAMTTETLAEDDEVMPGAPPSVPVQVKTPLEAWHDRIDRCRETLAKNGLPRDMLVLFEDSSVLQNCEVVTKKIYEYKEKEENENAEVLNKLGDLNVN